MTSLIVTVILAISISAFCSALEATLYAIPWTELEKLKSSGSRIGRILYRLKTNIEEPISAILTTNTIANTAGASIAGAFAAVSLGAEYMPVFAVLFTLLILIFGEILPKTLGVSYPTTLGKFFAYPLLFLTKLLKPATWCLSFLTRLITPQKKGPKATEEDIKAIAHISRKAGVIQSYEETAIKNILSLDKKCAYDVMTPRTVVFSLSECTTVKEACAISKFWHFSRIPVYSENNEDIIGIVLRRDVILKSQQEQNNNVKLSEIMHPVHFVPESVTLDKLLMEFLERTQHLFVVLDEYGGLSGVISLEDVIEEMIGREIVDESDMVDNLRETARLRRSKLIKKEEASH